ncbi:MULTISPECIES: metallophosphoesterase [Myxococcus]|uniref:Metallophosphoesterase n=1 Tax=Myxococcus llanfairpwllgwyngyllgogerychwyrndrobwllllantysiliogogogochensis TaxID=2590453 RepID=A0A540X376_9BACT|nr:MULTISPECIES: metallophosphoesterase [Myxococcus]NTX02695.1 metallophosphoesterase [Myxococcus sp. CA040A]NTX11117.1 metallophosphoesterase [Myxococcus sp. CA056]NTX34792.1 metallophosphoesterase [Myxococcus sp. CA033]NTX51920.1 metallophosphoesterase [Myxococcus sp. CA039A]TQF15134.1 metallophosphoesterase [Myxococcus llanfairpwllgwyngyllgogerychwyrndrobwllllantysiliogogogochensis]
MRLRRLARRRPSSSSSSGSHLEPLQGGRNEVVAWSGADPLRPERRLRWRDHFTLTENLLHLPHLPACHDGLRVAQLSDVHVGQATSEVRIRRAVEAVNAESPDLVFLTGDYVTHSPKPLPRVRDVLSGLKGRVFVVLGNHDHWVDAPYLRQCFEHLGYTVLQNEHRVVHLRGAPVTVLGVDDGRTGRDDVEATFRGAPESGTRLVLAHTPPTVDKLPAQGNLVQFSGHTHGGQFIVQGLTERLFRRAGQPYIRGHYQVNGNQLYVNRGLGFGFGGPYLRRGSEPEVAFFTLRAAATAIAAAG